MHAILRPLRNAAVSQQACRIHTAMGLQDWVSRNQVALTALNSALILIVGAAAVIVSVLSAKGTFERHIPALIEVAQPVRRSPDGSLLVSIRNRGDEATQVWGIGGGGSWYHFSKRCNEVSDPSMKAVYERTETWIEPESGWFVLTDAGGQSPIISPHSTSIVEVKVSRELDEACTRASTATGQESEATSPFFVPSRVDLHFATGLWFMLNIPPEVVQGLAERCVPRGMSIVWSSEDCAPQ